MMKKLFILLSIILFYSNSYAQKKGITQIGFSGGIGACGFDIQPVNEWLQNANMPVIDPIGSSLGLQAIIGNKDYSVHVSYIASSLFNNSSYGMNTSFKQSCFMEIYHSMLSISRNFTILKKIKISPAIGGSFTTYRLEIFKENVNSSLDTLFLKSNGMVVRSTTTNAVGSLSIEYKTGLFSNTTIIDEFNIGATAGYIYPIIQSDWETRSGQIFTIPSSRLNSFFIQLSIAILFKLHQ